MNKGGVVISVATLVLLFVSLSYCEEVKQSMQKIESFDEMVSEGKRELKEAGIKEPTKEEQQFIYDYYEMSYQRLKDRAMVFIRKGINENRFYHLEKAMYLVLGPEESKIVEELAIILNKYTDLYSLDLYNELEALASRHNISMGKLWFLRYQSRNVIHY